MNETCAAEILVRGLQLLLGCSKHESQNARKLEQALEYAAESQTRGRPVLARLALLRSAAAILQTTRPVDSATAESELLAVTRVALTAAMFELSADRDSAKGIARDFSGEADADERDVVAKPMRFEHDLLRRPLDAGSRSAGANRP